jgi:hypothetical protein
MRVRGSYGIAGDAFCCDLIAASGFDGVITAKDDDTPGEEHRHQEPEEQPTGFARRPDSPMQDAMIDLKVWRCTESHDAQHRGDRPLSRRKDSAGHEDCHMLPHGS